MSAYNNEQHLAELLNVANSRIASLEREVDSLETQLRALEDHATGLAIYVSQLEWDAKARATESHRLCGTGCPHQGVSVDERMRKDGL